MFRATAGSDGKFAFYGIPNVKMAIYATNGSTEAYFGTLTTTVADAPSEIKMSPAKSFSPSVEWDSIDFKYLDVNVKMTVGTVDYNTFFAVNTSGTYKIVIPENNEVSITVGLGSGNMYLKDGDNARKSVTTVLDSTKNAPSYVVYLLTAEADGVNESKKITINDNLGFDPDYYFKIDGTDVDSIADASRLGFAPDSVIKYTLGKVATSGASGVYHATGTYYFNPINGAFTLNLSDVLGCTDKSQVKYYIVNFTGIADGDKITVEGEDVIKGNDSATDSKEYLLKSGTDALVTIKNSAGTEIQYLKVNAGGNISKSLTEKVTIDGYVGADVDGTMVVDLGSGISFDVDIKDGSYSIELPKGADVTFAVNFVDAGVKYVANKTITGGFATSGAYNFALNGTGSIQTLVPIIDGDGTYVKVSKEISFTNIGDAGYFNIKFGDAWESAVATNPSGNVIDRIYAGNAPVTFNVTGYYNSDRYDLGSDAMAITLDGSYDHIISFKESTPVNNEGQIFFNKLDDEVSDHAYTYIVEVNNLLGHAQDFTVSEWERPAGWNVTVEVQAYGITIQTLDISKETSGTVVAYPGITTFRITYMPVGDATDVPDLKLKNELTLGTGELAKTLTSDTIVINGGIVTIEADPESAKVSAIDMNASGRGVFNEPGDIPTIVWVLFALAIILAILSVWMASKRGVFARKK